MIQIIQEKINNYIQLSNKGIKFNSSLEKNHKLKNPALLDELIHYISINPYGTNLDLNFQDLPIYSDIGTFVLNLASMYKENIRDRSSIKFVSENKD